MGFWFIVSIFLLGTGSQLLAFSAASCPNNPGWQWENIEGNCYFFSQSAGIKATWRQANSNCQNISSSIRRAVHLATFGDPNNCASDMKVMERITALGNNVWLGGMYRNGKWIWSGDNRELTLSFPLWGPNEPNNAKGDEYCLATSYQHDSIRQYLNDEACDKMAFYVCQRS